MTAGEPGIRSVFFPNQDYALLTLPDSQGRIAGIDQLFGDNTFGPDGAFAANGYAALAKYDGKTSDGRLDLIFDLWFRYERIQNFRE